MLGTIREYIVNSPNVAVIGATGAVGRQLLDVLQEREFSLGDIRLTASHRSIGKEVSFRGVRIAVEETTQQVFAESDLAFIAAGDDISGYWAPIARDSGCVVIDKSSAWRMEEDVPLVVPEVNASDLGWHAGIIATPNCSTTPLVMILHALEEAGSIRHVVVSTYQSVSGTGKAAMDELDEQSRALLAGGEARLEQYPHQIAFNLLPHIGSFGEDGYMSEETKMLNETRRILGHKTLAVSATCVRVPVRVCHSEAITIVFEYPVDLEMVRELLGRHPGIVVADDPSSNNYPMPVDVEGKDDVFVGRIRKDAVIPNVVSLWAVSDNLRKGAATNAVQIAEELVSRGLISRVAAPTKELAGVTA